MTSIVSWAVISDHQIDRPPRSQAEGWNKYIKHYKDRGSTPFAVTRCTYLELILDQLAENRVDTADFRHYFTVIHKEAAPIGAKRLFYSYVTSDTNPRSMRSIVETRECCSSRT